MLELGSGVGVSGIIAQIIGLRCTLTDYLYVIENRLFMHSSPQLVRPSALGLSIENIRANQHKMLNRFSSASKMPIDAPLVRLFDWKQPTPAALRSDFADCATTAEATTSSPDEFSWNDSDVTRWRETKILVAA